MSFTAVLSVQCRSEKDKNKKDLQERLVIQFTSKKLFDDLERDGFDAILTHLEFSLGKICGEDVYISDPAVEVIGVATPSDKVDFHIGEDHEQVRKNIVGDNHVQVRNPVSNKKRKTEDEEENLTNYFVMVTLIEYKDEKEGENTIRHSSSLFASYLEAEKYEESLKWNCILEYFNEFLALKHTTMGIPKATVLHRLEALQNNKLHYLKLEAYLNGTITPSELKTHFLELLTKPQLDEAFMAYSKGFYVASKHWVLVSQTKLGKPNETTHPSLYVSRTLLNDIKLQ